MPRPGRGIQWNSTRFRKRSDDRGSFCEVNRRRRSRRGIRKNFPNHLTVVELWMHQCFALHRPEFWLKQVSLGAAGLKWSNICNITLNFQILICYSARPRGPIQNFCTGPQVRKWVEIYTATMFCRPLQRQLQALLKTIKSLITKEKCRRLVFFVI